jgi:hypothetical protein
LLAGVPSVTNPVLGRELSSKFGSIICFTAFVMGFSVIGVAGPAATAPVGLSCFAMSSVLSSFSRLHHLGFRLDIEFSPLTIIGQRVYNFKFVTKILGE